MTPRYLAGQYDQVIDEQDRAGFDNLNYFQLTWRAMALVKLGRDKEAADLTALIRTKDPELSYEYLWNNGWILRGPGTQERVLADYRATGLRICATPSELADVARPLRLAECVQS